MGRLLRSLGIWVALAALPLAPSARAGEVYYLSGVVQPRFLITAAVNGHTVETVYPNAGKAAEFRKLLDPNLLRRGTNALTVTYNVLMRPGRRKTPGPGFEVRLDHGSDEKDAATPLAEVRGPTRPVLEPGAGGTITRTFTVGE